jgi:hypothetical protein
MNQTAKDILAEFETDPNVGDLFELSECEHPLWLMDVLDGFRRWLGVPGPRRPSPEYLGVLLAHGRESLIRLYRAYEEAAPPEQAGRLLKAFAQLVRFARSRGTISWDINSVRVDDGRGKLLVAFDPTLDAKLRSCAQSEGQTLNDFVRMAVSARVESVEKSRPATTA